jgi:hypothetical protein
MHAGGTPASFGGTRAVSASATGSYRAFFSVGFDTALQVSADHTATWPDFGDSGTWEQFGKTAAFLVTVNEKGCIEIGTVSRAGINSLAAPGPYFCPGPSEGTWYANRNP